ncbi:hypothetical protein CSOJ01_11295 [Colletotrichum sojae]|uniref:Uncharacterized protein n=1 Tax=Colletotrichum sojae TaxID=2175907 RepID=A0A8H6IYM6_9PEZI|nr:hypothetical protein CSOJ01_11295 [Colletotrichum sojae]
MGQDLWLQLCLVPCQPDRRWFEEEHCTWQWSTTKPWFCVSELNKNQVALGDTSWLPLGLFQRTLGSALSSYVGNSAETEKAKVRPFSLRTAEEDFRYSGTPTPTAVFSNSGLQQVGVD